MERIENHRAVLDFGSGLRVVFTDDAEIEMTAHDRGISMKMSRREGRENVAKPAVELAGQRVLIMGLARTGFATAQFCAGRGARVTVVEERPENAAGTVPHGIGRGIADDAGELRAMGVSVHCGGHFPELFAEADLIIPSPGVPANLPELARARDADITVWSEIELAWRFLHGRLFAVTGSNGKTTTVSLLGHILQHAEMPALVGGNIGQPLISLVDRSCDSTVTVAEVSTFQLELIEAFRPDVAILLNITPDHLDRHGSFEEYARLKRQIFANQLEQDEAVMNADDQEVSKSAPKIPCVSWFSRQGRVERGAYIHAGEIVLRDGGKELPVMPVDEVPLPGAHNLENTLAASFTAHLAGVSPEVIAIGIRGFTAVEHRLEFVTEIGGVRFYNDSKATNVDAALKALESFSQPVYIILGGKDKGGDFSLLREPLRRHARRALLIGEAAEKIAVQIAGAVPVELVGTLAGAVAAAWGSAGPGEIILLAPACASFDQFQNFEHRGRVFKQLAGDLHQNLVADASAGKVD
jgi:UDP-N-acetylmuramoylalanine--D-glutamate ligase